MTGSGLADDLAALETYQGQDIAAGLAHASAIEAAAARDGDEELAYRARLVRAELTQRNGDVGSAAREFLTVHRWAQEHGRSAVRARSHFHLSLTHHYLGDRETSLEHAIASVELLERDAPPGLRVMYLIRLANTLVESGAADAARERYRQAESLAVSIGDLTRQLLVLNNLAYTEFEAGEIDEAWSVVQRMQEVAARLGRDFLIVEQDTIANIQIARGEFAAAAESVRAAVEDDPGWSEAHNLADATLTLATALRHLGRHSEAQEALDRCQAVCHERKVLSVRVRARAEQAELHAATGNFKAAFTTFKRYHTELEEMRSTEREARARTRQAMFETAEARQDAARYREQARRDALTGLYNRRYVDEHLPALIADASHAGAPLTLAMVDLDYFKRINDTLSHEVGDRVLSDVAGLLADAMSRHGQGFAARLGGEEFLIVQSGAGSAEVRTMLEELRVGIRSYPWAPLTGELPVTVSVGAVTGAATGLADLLAAADRNLYEAKNSGRDRVVLTAVS